IGRAARTRLDRYPERPGDSETTRRTWLRTLSCVGLCAGRHDGPGFPRMARRDQPSGNQAQLIAKIAKCRARDGLPCDIVVGDRDEYADKTDQAGCVSKTRWSPPRRL